jgi:class 3 adenylate cyclase
VLAERGNRTFICSVLFLDIVEYSRKPVAEQIQLKDEFNSLIAEAIRDISPSDRIILDTGDGVAINFLGDPEDALFVAMSLRDFFAPDPDAPPRFPARVGVNLGPVRLVKDLNGQPNIIGDGINVAQRVMGFARPGQVLVARSYYEVVSHISEGYGQLFKYEGSRTDKHVREHEVYSVGYTSGARLTVRSPAERAQASSRARALQSVTASIVSGTLLARVEPWLNNRSIAYGTATLSVAAFGSALLLNLVSEPAQSERHSRPEDTPVVINSNTVTQAEPKDRSLFGIPRAAEKKPAAAKREADPEASAEPAGAQPEVQPPAAEGSAVITLAITPWGEVFIDGNRVGVSPPVNEVEVAPGRRRIEVRNGNFPVYTQVVELKADQKIRIKHKFN